ncbi:unnamed protein product [Diplocarpon coronariae]|uniref:Uncharacterized protein n=1 Tax=Diplocarpon coronariae TaxID=2795749 RepID=A0A218Z5K4_9HELO|nr:hypothetical protein JHW43_008428 [Diplocarpon mali]OWP02525.1 hypothetical protein B2J93_2733 [Marssonina coronariae]
MNSAQIIQCHGQGPPVLLLVPWRLGFPKANSNFGLFLNRCRCKSSHPLEVSPPRELPATKTPGGCLAPAILDATSLNATLRVSARTCRRIIRRPAGGVHAQGQLQHRTRELPNRSTQMVLAVQIVDRSELLPPASRMRHSLSSYSASRKP